MIHLYSGEGRGKTSIAVGTAIRMAGAGKKVIFAQFMKGQESSEIEILSSLPNVEICCVPEEFPFYNQMSEEQMQRITKYHNDILMQIMDEIRCVGEKGEGGRSPKLLVVLDEITYPVSWNLIDQTLVNHLLSDLPESVELIMTGRNPSEEMIAFSDYWSEVTKKRHPYEKGVMARKGVEY